MGNSTCDLENLNCECIVLYFLTLLRLWQACVVSGSHMPVRKCYSTFSRNFSNIGSILCLSFQHSARIFRHKSALSSRLSEIREFRRRIIPRRRILPILNLLRACVSEVFSVTTRMHGFCSVRAFLHTTFLFPMTAFMHGVPFHPRSGMKFHRNARRRSPAMD